MEKEKRTAYIDKIRSGVPELQVSSVPEYFAQIQCELIIFVSVNVGLSSDTSKI